MKLLVTGASGFIGRNLLLALPREYQVTALYCRSTDFTDFLASTSLGRVVPLQADLSSDEGAATVAAVSKEFESCVFLAANGDPAVSVGQPAFDLTANCLSLVKLLEKVRFGKLIYFSSGAVYDGLIGAVNPSVAIAPRLPYAISKWASENYLGHFQHRGQIGQSVIVRFFGAYGPHEPARKIYSRLVRQFGIQKDPRFTIRGDGKNLIDAMYVSDAVRAIQLLLEGSQENLTVDLFSGQTRTLSQLVSEAAAVFGLIPEILYEGVVPEYIEFYATDPTFQRSYGFNPSVDLAAGLIHLYQHLHRSGHA